MSGNTGVKVFAPASIAGFSTGISIMSVAVNHLGDELKARLTTKHNGVKIESISGYKKGMSKEVNMSEKRPLSSAKSRASKLVPKILIP